ncbi:MAG: hypothetical protein ACTSQI_01990 [Candidatus Helarchaeota archaeon]
MSFVGNALSLGFIIVLILLTLTFNIALMNQTRRKTFAIISAILLAVAFAFMAIFIMGWLFFPEIV